MVGFPKDTRRYASLLLKLLSPSLATLVIKSDNCDFNSGVMATIPKMTRLTHLDFDGPFRGIGNVVTLRNTLSVLTNLKRVTITSFTPTAVINILESLRPLPDIKDISFRCLGGPDSVMKGVRPHVKFRQYPQLGTLRFLRAQPALVFVIMAKYSFRSMENLHLDLVSVGDVSFSDLVKMVAASCSSLKLLDILSDEPKYAAVKFDDFIDLKFLRLEHFSIKHEFPLDISLRHILQIAAWWGPTIQYLSLNPNPAKTHVEQFGPSVPQLDLRALMILGVACPKLIGLSIYIDASQPAREFHSHSTLPPTLRFIDFGCSNVDRPHVSMNFFSTLEPSPSAAIRLTATAVEHRRPNYHFRSYVYAAQSFWTTVENMVNLRSRHTPSVGGDIWRRRPLTLTWPPI